MPLPVAAEAYSDIVALIDLDWLRRALPTTLPGEDSWESRAVASLLEVLLDMRRQLTLQVLGHDTGAEPLSDRLEAFAARCRDQLDVVNDLLSDLKAAPQLTLPALLVLMREIGRLARQPERERAW